MEKKILLLHDGGEAPQGVSELAGDLRALGAEVAVAPCAEPYDAVLDAVANADSVVYYR
jgi:hypothetical protein